MNLFIRKRILLLAALLLTLAACAASIPYKAYLGDPRHELQLSTVSGVSFQRNELLNLYTDTVRFMEVDQIPIQNSALHHAIQITPGFHEVRVYFSWDIGSLRGMARAMIDYARTQDHISRTLRFNAGAGKSYIVMANPVFSGSRNDITTLAHVDFWVEDQDGNEIVSKEEGRYIEEL